MKLFSAGLSLLEPVVQSFLIADGRVKPLQKQHTLDFKAAEREFAEIPLRVSEWKKYASMWAFVESLGSDAEKRTALYDAFFFAKAREAYRICDAAFRSAEMSEYNAGDARATLNRDRFINTLKTHSWISDKAEEVAEQFDKGGDTIREFLNAKTNELSEKVTGEKPFAVEAWKSLYPYVLRADAFGATAERSEAGFKNELAKVCGQRTGFFVRHGADVTSAAAWFMLVSGRAKTKFEEFQKNVDGFLKNSQTCFSSAEGNVPRKRKEVPRPFYVLDKLAIHEANVGMRFCMLWSYNAVFDGYGRRQIGPMGSTYFYYQDPWDVFWLSKGPFALDRPSLATRHPLPQMVSRKVRRDATTLVNELEARVVPPQEMKPLEMSCGGQTFEYFSVKGSGLGPGCQMVGPDGKGGFNLALGNTQTLPPDTMVLKVGGKVVMSSVTAATNGYEGARIGSLEDLKRELARASRLPANPDSSAAENWKRSVTLMVVVPGPDLLKSCGAPGGAYWGAGNGVLGGSKPVSGETNLRGSSKAIEAAHDAADSLAHEEAGVSAGATAGVSDSHPQVLPISDKDSHAVQVAMDMTRYEVKMYRDITWLGNCREIAADYLKSSSGQGLGFFLFLPPVPSLGGLLSLICDTRGFFWSPIPA